MRAFVCLDALPPDWVDVQVVHGKVTPADVLIETATQSLEMAEAYEGGRYRYEGRVRLRRTGPFGYTVRILPRHLGLAGPAELGLVVNA